jgi:hypothetical protein
VCAEGVLYYKNTVRILYEYCTNTVRGETWEDCISEYPSLSPLPAVLASTLPLLCQQYLRVPPPSLIWQQYLRVPPPSLIWQQYLRIQFSLRCETVMKLVPSFTPFAPDRVVTPVYPLSTTCLLPVYHGLPLNTTVSSSLPPVYHLSTTPHRWSRVFFSRHPLSCRDRTTIVR